MGVKHCLDKGFKYTRADDQGEGYLREKFARIRRRLRLRKKAPVVATIEPKRKKT